MTKSRKLVFVAFLLLVLAACSSFTYKYYGLAPDSWDGVLLGKTAKDDIPLSVCKPDDQIKGKCVVMMVDEYERLRADYIQLSDRLKACVASHQ